MSGSTLCIVGVDCETDAFGDVETWPAWAIAWSVCLSSVASLNLALCLRTATTRQYALDGATQSYQALMRNLAVPYVLVNALRSYFPAQYGDRLVFWDSPLSSILLHRSAATVAELCWVLQIAFGVMFIEGQLWRERYGSATPGWFSWYGCAQVTCSLMIAIIATAECFSFCGTITRSDFWFTLEEASWCVAFALTAPNYMHVMIAARNREEPAESTATTKKEKETCMCAATFGLIFTIFALCYVPYMAFIDVPFYWDSYQQQVAAGFVPLTVGEGIYDALLGWRVTQQKADWSFAAAWSSIYFAAGSWVSIAMMSGPRLLAPAPDQGLGSPLRKLAVAI